MDDLDDKLHRWGRWVRRVNIPGLSYPSSSPLTRIGEPRHSVVIVPGYVADPQMSELNAAIMSIGTRYRDVLFFRYVIQLRGDSLAEKMRCSRSTAHRDVKRAKARLKSYITGR